MRAVLPLLLVGVVASFAGADTNVSGTITTTTWTKANSPYHVTDTITVPSGNTLTIEPGVDVLFDADVLFDVQGRLQAIGTSAAADSIRFLASASVGQGTNTVWGGLQITGGGGSTIAYARISDGNAASNGGGISVVGQGSYLSLYNSAVVGNVAGNDGGGVYAGSRGLAVLTRCAVARNAVLSGWGGGVAAVYNGVAVLRECTVCANSDAGDGGTIGAYSDGMAVIAGSIVWGNIAEAVLAVDATVTAMCSDIEGGWGTDAHRNINADPGFVDAAAGDYHLQPSSPCIDSGDPSSPLDPDGTRADMGAFYYHHISCPTPAITVNDPVSLWPPNHQYVSLAVQDMVGSVDDGAGGSLPVGDVEVTSASSDELEDAKGNGDGSTLNDIVIAADRKSVQLRAERNGSGNGRVYTVNLRVVNACGNEAVATFIASVPKSQGQNGAAADDGPAHMVAAGGLGKPTRALPTEFSLSHNVPNPFNPSTTIRFALPEAGPVRLGIYDVNGRVLRTLVDGFLNAGAYEVVWDGADRAGRPVASGVYLYRLTSQQGTIVRRMVLVR